MALMTDVLNTGTGVMGASYGPSMCGLESQWLSVYAKLFISLHAQAVYHASEIGCKCSIIIGFVEGCGFHGWCRIGNINAL
jgi:hypothetical protein